MNDEVREHRVLDRRNFIGKRIRPPGIVCPEKSADRDEAERDGKIQEAPEADGLHGVASVFGRYVPLRVALVYAEVLQIYEDRVYERHPERLARPVAKRE